LNKVQAK